MKDKIINVIRSKLTRRTVICLIFLLIIISNSYFIAKYNSSIQATSEASVAVWNVNSDIDNDDVVSLNLISGNTVAEYNIKVSSISQVATKYSIILTNVPNGLEVKLDDTTNYKTYTTPTNNTITFSDVGSFVASDEVTEHTHTLTFNNPLNTNNSGSKSIKIDVIIDQID